jgi:hypothetical protein
VPRLRGRGEQGGIRDAEIPFHQPIDWRLKKRPPPDGRAHVASISALTPKTPQYKKTKIIVFDP